VRPEHLVGLDEAPSQAARLSALDEDAFTAALAGVFEASPWVARAAYAAGPFADLDALHAAMVAAVRAAPREQQLALIRAHPELAAPVALSDASEREQASAGLDRLNDDEAERWRALNARYRERFGFPLVVCVREHTQESILAWAEERLGHERDEEVEIALGEIGKIARLRLRELDE
jgi:OHCU decarboxylase